MPNPPKSSCGGSFKLGTTSPHVDWLPDSALGIPVSKSLSEGYASQWAGLMLAGQYNFLHLCLQGDCAHLCRVELPVRHRLGPARAESCDQDSRDPCQFQIPPNTDLHSCTCPAHSPSADLGHWGPPSLGISACPQMTSWCRGWWSPAPQNHSEAAAANWWHSGVI